MAEEPSLPRLPAVSWNEHSQTFSNNPRKRARYPHSGGLYNSSDPAVFSSDDDPGLDNYVEGRKKKRYVGTWFQQHPTSSDSTFSEALTLPQPKRERKLVRQLDSGVYLGSDGSDDLCTEELEVAVRPKWPQLDQRPPAPTLSRAELLAREKIQVCLEQGDETVDFWSMGLGELSHETLSPLANFSCIPMVTKDVAFEQKEPELKMYLAMNRLRLIPGALFELQHLTILSLRGNKLSEIPPAIAKLSNLKQLNVSQNRLRSLPAELMRLFDLGLRDLVLHPNPFFEPESSLSFERALDENDDRLKSTVERLVSRFLGRSPLQVSDSMGQVLSAFKFPSYSESNKVAVADGGGGGGGDDDDDDDDDDNNNNNNSVDVGHVVPMPSRVPSLVELAVRSCYSTNELPQLSHYIPDGLSHIRGLLERAVRQKEMGGISCTKCQKLVVVPAMEWVEWRDIHTVDKTSSGRIVRALSVADDERAIPFLHRGCSWQCGPAGKS
ncbi:hypothetical protein E4U43_001213 [Claviceps pusilla]|uniref:Leucine Rich Repeat domain protein n=1 Tax=Claviceps pusilla TaxID=123648 RepID=A0A9P7N8P4_9HYPO|nr:hypothetical protein E4U43_001213 [Claviceps pusilla]